MCSRRGMVLQCADADQCQLFVENNGLAIVADVVLSNKGNEAVFRAATKALHVLAKRSRNLVQSCRRFRAVPSRAKSLIGAPAVGRIQLGRGIIAASLRTLHCEIIQPYPSFVSAVPISAVLEALSSAIKQGASVEKVVSLRQLLKSASTSNWSRLYPGSFQALSTWSCWKLLLSCCSASPPPTLVRGR